MVAALRGARQTTSVALRPQTEGRTLAWSLGLALFCAGVFPVVNGAHGTNEANGSTATDDAPPPASNSIRSDVRFGRDIRPLLSDRCFACHGTDPATREGGLRLDVREEAVGGDVPAVVPGHPEESELWRRIHSEDPVDAMPPPHAKKRPLTQQERDLLEAWIRAGAEYEPHWAFVAPQTPPVPPVENEAWARSPIDAFVLARLEQEGVAPSPEADPQTLLRRLHLDLTGLPPTPEELDAFAADSANGAAEASTAYEQAVERLFTEEPYRSRMAEWLATDWMDVARYADTNGTHTDNGRQMWLWRDWVLEAFRSNMPFDRFVTYQMAGDLLAEAGVEGKVASGFHRNHVTTDEGGAIPEEYLLEYAVDRVTTTSSAFLGLTMGCARCHDHKYDPITQEDFYGLVGFFNSVDEPGLYSQTDDPNRAYEPFLEVPSPEQERELDELRARIDALDADLAQPLTGEDEGFAAFRDATTRENAVAWSTPNVLTATSTDADVTLAVQPDASVLATGPLADFEDYVVTLDGVAAGARLVLIEALATPPADPEAVHPPGAGRADHGNAVLSHVRLERRGATGATGTTGDTWDDVPLRWAWADHLQHNQDFAAPNVLTPDARGWAADGNEHAGARNLLLLAERSFGETDAAGTPPTLRLTLSFRSSYAQHSLAHLRVRTSPMPDASRLPVDFGRWYRCGPFSPAGSGEEARQQVYATDFGPEGVTSLALDDRFGDDQLPWTFDGTLDDDQAVSLPGETIGATYVGRSVWSPDARTITAFVGSDDGFALFLNGEEVAAHVVDRGVGDEDEVRLDLRPGENVLVLKVVNTGGPTGYSFRWLEDEAVLLGELPSALVPAEAVPTEQVPELRTAWRRRFFSVWREGDDERRALRAQRDALRADVPRTMVMHELDEPRPSHVLMRGQYDAPDETRPVARRAPSFLPPLPADAPRDREGLAHWLIAPENPLFARVQVNRYWQLLFGAGLVRSSGDFGLQGDWPSHPELLDWLACSFAASGWDLHALLRSIVLSSTYRQASIRRPELFERDPNNRWLAFYPRRRMTAEQIRDLALFTSGLLVERFGGPSVKPYQPDGLWREVAMLSSNTRVFELGRGEELWRRSLYTYWKRAVPPPALLTFDAPTRESCTLQRQRTNTPLQALVLWNDEQFVEAARALAARTVRARTSDEDGLARLFQRCTGRRPDAEEGASLRDHLDALRQRFHEAPEDASALLAVGVSPLPDDVPPAELAAWTLVANAVLNLHESLTQD